jgi:hypothetical protein
MNKESPIKNHHCPFCCGDMRMVFQSTKNSSGKQGSYKTRKFDCEFCEYKETLRGLHTQDGFAANTPIKRPATINGKPLTISSSKNDLE